MYFILSDTLQSLSCYHVTSRVPVLVLCQSSQPVCCTPLLVYICRSILSSMTSLISSRRLYDRAQAVGNASPAVHTLSKKPHRTDLEKPPADSHSQMESVKSTEGSALPSLSTKHSRTLLKADRTSPKKELVKLPAAPTPLASVKKLGRKLSKRKQKPERCQ